MVLPRLSSPPFLLIVTFIVAVALLVHVGADAAVYNGCPGTLAGENFGSSTFSLTAGCALTIDGGTATDLTFTTAHTDLVLIVKGSLTCAASTSPGSCIRFSGTLTGGSIDIRGVSRAIGPGAVTTGDYNVVRFFGAVTGTDISIIGITVTLNGVTSTGVLNVNPVHAATNVAGKNTTGSIFNMSNMRVTGSATSSGGGVQLRAVNVIGTVIGY